MKRKPPKTTDDNNFMSSISTIVEGLVENKEQAKVANEEELTFLQQPAPNVIEFVSSPSFLNIKTLFNFNRQYQVLRDFFGLYCPICNSMKPEATDAWGKSKETLQSEVLLVWSNTYNDDVCPKCSTTRAELVQDKLIHEYNHLHAIVGMRCVPGDTRVVTNNGLVRIKDLWKGDLHKDTFQSINECVLGEHGYELASDVYCAGTADTLKITLVKGLTVEGSHIHPVQAIKAGKFGWYKLNELTIGDKIKCTANYWPSIAKDTPINAELVKTCESRMNYESKYVIPKIWSEDLATLLGYFTSEGQCDREYGIRFTNGDEETLQHFSDTCARVFGKVPVSYTDDGITVDLNGIGIRELLNGLGLERHNAHVKRVPQSIWMLNKEYVTAYLRSYFEGDGTAAIEKSGFNKAAVAAYTVSLSLAQDLQQLLWALGVKASISKTKSRKFRSQEKFAHNSYSIRIYGENILRFSKLIGFNSARKKSALAACVDKVLSTGKYTKTDDNFEFLKIKKIEMGTTQNLFDLHVPGTHSFMAGSIVNHNSGKTVTAAQIGNYIEHRLVNIALRQPSRNLADYFGLLPEGAFEMTFIASSETQSADTIWTIYRNLRDASPWFKRYVGWIKEQEAIQEHKPGMEKWKYLETGKEIRNDYFNLKLNSKNSNSAGLAGRTRIAAMIDELCRFQQSEGASLGAEEAFRVMDNSLRTVRSAVKNHKLISWLGLNMTISSPISVDDYGMTLLERAKTTPSMYAIHKATWEWNPNEKIEYFKEAMENDPVGTMRDFGARPPLAANPLITNVDIFNEKAIDPELKPSAEIVTMPFTDKIGTPYFRAMMTSCEFRRDVPRFVVFDAGQMFDAFTGAAAHVELVQNPDGTTDFVTVFDWIMRVLPNSTTQVWFDSAEQIIEEMLKYQKIAKVEFDHWQSVGMIQHIRNLGVQADTKTIKADDFVKFVADTNMNKVRMLPKNPDDDDLEPPMKSPQAVALYEISKLERSMDGSKIYNANKGKKRGYNSDDCARVVVHVHKLVQESQVIPQGAKARSKESRLKSEMLSAQNYTSNQLGRVFHPRNTFNLGKGGTRRW